jgi:hypothetical protein
MFERSNTSSSILLFEKGNEKVSGGQKSFCGTILSRKEQEAKRSFLPTKKMARERF